MHNIQRKMKTKLDKVEDKCEGAQWICEKVVGQIQLLDPAHAGR